MTEVVEDLLIRARWVDKSDVPELDLTLEIVLLHLGVILVNDRHSIDNTVGLFAGSLSNVFGVDGRSSSTKGEKTEQHPKKDSKAVASQVGTTFSRVIESTIHPNGAHSKAVSIRKVDAEKEESK